MILLIQKNGILNAFSFEKQKIFSRMKHIDFRNNIVTAILRLEFWKTILPHPMTCFWFTFIQIIVFNIKIKSIFENKFQSI